MFLLAFQRTTLARLMTGHIRIGSFGIHANASINVMLSWFMLAKQAAVIKSNEFARQVSLFITK